MNAILDESAKPLRERLIAVCGSEAVIDDAEELAFYSSDVYAAGKTAAFVVAPPSRAAVADVVREITSAGFAVVARGGGMSYTGGYVPERDKAVILDMSGLRRIIDVNADDMTITVEAGVTWKAIHDTLAPLGLRLPFFGTFSGSRATVGGGMSNGALFMGTARYGTAAEIVLGLEVVTSDGRVIRTGQAGFENGRPFFRSYGPDLTGLFVHDAGALGVKTLVSMRLIRPPAEFGYASFVFERSEQASEALSAVAREGLTEEAYVFDPATTRRSLDQQDLARDLKRLLNVVRSEKGLLSGVRAGARLVGAGRRFGADNLYSMHVVASADTKVEVDRTLDRCREIADSNDGGEIASSIPKAARANPFEPLNGILGADGERWAALNAKIAHSDARRVIDATDAILESHREAMQKHRVSVSRLFIAISNHVFSFEPVLRWYDEWLPVHRRTPEPSYLAKLEEPPPNPEGRALVERIRREIVALFAGCGVASSQIGKTYPYFDSLEPQTATLVRDLKRALDPDDLMNPGALGLPGADGQG